MSFPKILEKGFSEESKMLNSIKLAIKNFLHTITFFYIYKKVKKKSERVDCGRIKATCLHVEPGSACECPP